MPNLKISELNRAKRVSDDAIIVVVQDNANKTITVKELGDVINYKQNLLIGKLHDEVKQASQSGNYIALKNIIAKHEYRLNNIDRQLVKQYKLTSDSINIAKQSKEDAIHAIKIAEIANAESKLTRKGLAFVNSKADNAIKDVKAMSTYLSYLGEYTEKIKDDAAETFGTIASYVHIKKEDYWGTLKSTIDIAK